MDIPQVQGEGLCVCGVRSVGYQMVDLRKARATDTSVCESTYCCLGVSEWLKV